ncbi:FMRFamide receptor-like [Brachionus plicatilis]|uniref:FMRFamide receptor-like n=1 Tax=Brachionus plicatilis TaxID=10195 RepID=A0A3M7SVE9_BRAPC|nr:FMRFamide receptor-like [Brachionus plicatilis]
MASRTAEEVGPFTSLMRLIFKDILMHICITLGVLGNILTLIILLQKKMRHTSTSQYLTFLTVFDLLYIVSCFFNNLEIMYSNNMLIEQIRPYINLIFYPLGDFSANTSAYLILVFTIERFVAVAYPLNSRFWCRPSRARKIILATVIFTFLLTFPTFLENKIAFIHDPDLNRTRAELVDSGFYPNFDFYKLIYFWLIAIMVQFIPLTLLIVLNGFLMKYIHGSIKLKQINLTNNFKPFSTDKPSIELRVHRKSDLTVQNTYKNTSQSDQNKVTILLIATVLLFLICQVPSALLLIYEAIFPLDNDVGYVTKDIRLGLNNIANGLTAINASVNFILYSCFSDKFRQTFRAMFLNKTKRNESTMYSKIRTIVSN